MNKVILMGRLTRDPELRYTASETYPNARFPLRWTEDSPNRAKRGRRIFNIVAWRNQAEFCSKYFTKGQRVAVIGSLQNKLG